MNRIHMTNLWKKSPRVFIAVVEDLFDTIDTDHDDLATTDELLKFFNIKDQTFEEFQSGLVVSFLPDENKKVTRENFVNAYCLTFRE